MKTLLLLFSYVITALPGFSQEQKTLEDQLIIITVYTKQNNYIKGLLHEISDTSVTVYPGDKNTSLVRYATVELPHCLSNFPSLY